MEEKTPKPYGFSSPEAAQDAFDKCSHLLGKRELVSLTALIPRSQ